MENESDLHHTNMTLVMSILLQFFERNNLSDLDHDLSSEQLSSILRTSGIISNQRTLTKGNLMDYSEYRIHKIISLYIPPFLLFLGILGNVMSFLVLRHGSMNSLSTNTYLTALSVGDSCVLFIGLFRKWLGEILQMDFQTRSSWLCKIVALLGYSTSQYSVWLIVAVTAERYIVICHPLQTRIFCSKARARKIVCLLASLFLLLNSHLLWTADLEMETYGNNTIYSCEAVYIKLVWPWIDAMLYSFIPTPVILILNILIMRKVMQAASGRNRTLVQRIRYRQDSNAKLTLTLLAISFTFLLTTLPMNIVMIFTLAWNEDLEKDFSSLAKSWLTRTVAELLMYLNHSVNFYLYIATGSKFRKVLFRMICGGPVLNSTTTSSVRRKTNSLVPNQYVHIYGKKDSTV